MHPPSLKEEFPEVIVFHFLLQSWNSITGKGCFYLELDTEEEEENETRSHRYHLTLPAATNVWVEMGVASPGLQAADVLMLVFQMNAQEEVTEIITYTQHKVEDVSLSTAWSESWTTVFVTRIWAYTHEISSMIVYTVSVLHIIQ